MMAATSAARKRARNIGTATFSSILTQIGRKEGTKEFALFNVNVEACTVIVIILGGGLLIQTSLGPRLSLPRGPPLAEISYTSVEIPWEIAKNLEILLKLARNL